MQGTQWSEEETWIIHDKLQTLMLSSDNVVDEYQKLHPKGPKYKKLMQPNPPKVRGPFNANRDCSSSGQDRNFKEPNLIVFLNLQV